MRNDSTIKADQSNFSYSDGRYGGFTTEELWLCSLLVHRQCQDLLHRVFQHVHGGHQQKRPSESPRTSLTHSPIMHHLTPSHSKTLFIISVRCNVVLKSAHFGAQMTVGRVSLLKALNFDRSLGGKQLQREFGMSVSLVVFQSYPLYSTPVILSKYG